MCVLLFSFEIQVHTYDEIGAIYGITRERVRQIENKTMSKLRHPRCTGFLRDFLDTETAASSPCWSAETVKAPRKFVRSLGEQALKTNLEIPIAIGSTYEDEWPTADKNETSQSYEMVEAVFTNLLLTANLYNFQQSFAYSMDSFYPKALIDTIEETLGKDLTPGHIEQFWNTHLGTFIERLQLTVGDDISFDRIGQLFSALLAERMTDDDTITLTIPPNAEDRLSFIGAWIQNGSLIINGDVGDNAAYKAKGLAEIIINGNAGDYVGAQSAGYANVVVAGTAGDMVGYRAGGNSAVIVLGSSGDFAGSCLHGQATVTIEGHVGEYCACELQSPYAEVKVKGNAGAFLADEAASGVIVVAGAAKSYSPKNGFTGQLYIGGQKIQTDKSED